MSKKKTTKRRPVRRTPVTTRAAAAGPTQVRHTLPEKVAALPNFECPYDTGSFGVYGYPGETTITLVFADGKGGTRVTFPKRCGGALCNAIMNACGIASIRQKRDGVTSFTYQPGPGA